MNRRSSVRLACCSLFVLLALVPSQATSNKSDADAAPALQNHSDDPLLNALLIELERSKDQLKLPQMQSPYYIEYSVLDNEDYSASASYGALTSQQRNHIRLLSVLVRVGSYKQDNYTGFGSSVLDLLPLENDSLALRHAIWLATDQAYKRAVQTYAAKQAMLQQFQEVQPVDDFSHESPVQLLGSKATLNLTERNWPKLMESVSSLYKKDLLLESFNAEVHFSVTNRYFVNSEGTLTRRAASVYQLGVTGSTQAPDGMLLTRSYGKAVADVQALPSDAELAKEASTLLDTLHDLRQTAAVKEEYRGPVLFSADAADTVIGALIGENILGDKPKPGASQRTSGAYGNSYKSRILPDFVSIVDDPTLKNYHSQPLIGGYEVDDEGVRAQPVTVVEKGVLVNYLMSRQPVRDFPHSNGHGRASLSFFGLQSAPNVGNLIVQSSQALAHDELKKKLIELCRQRDLPYGYYVETMAPPNADNRGNNAGDAESGDESPQALRPRLLYRVWVKDGHEELVRGAEFGELDARALRSDLAAMGDDPLVENSNELIPRSIVSPSMLFDELEVKGSEAVNDKLPQYPAPALATKP